jgi:hypothetical protein
MVDAAIMVMLMVMVIVIKTAKRVIYSSRLLPWNTCILTHVF